MEPCEQFKQQILDLIDGELDFLQKNNINKHLKACHHCSDFFKRMNRIQSYLKRLTPVESPDSFLILLRERIRREMAGKPNNFHLQQFPLWKLAAISCCSVLIFILGFRMLDQRTWKKTRSPVHFNQMGLTDSSVDNLMTDVHYVLDDFPAEGSQTGFLQQERQDKVEIDSNQVKETLEMIQAQLKPVKF